MRTFAVLGAVLAGVACGHRALDAHQDGAGAPDAPASDDAGGSPNVDASLESIEPADAEPDLVRDRETISVPGCPAPKSAVAPLGEATAPVKAFLFQDLAGPFDRKLAKNSLARLRSDYVEQSARIELFAVDYPLEFHPNAARASEAARAADVFGAFWPMRDLLLDRQMEWTDLAGVDATSLFASYAQMLGLDAAAFAVEASRLRGTRFTSVDEAKACGSTGVPFMVFLVPKALAKESDLHASGAYVKDGGTGWIGVIKGSQEWSAFSGFLDAIHFP